MDSLTQIVLGGAVGELVLGRKVGNKAVLWGAIGGTIPDLDVIGRSFLETVDALDFHRGPMHSIVFAIALAPLLGWLISKIHHKADATWKQWAWLSFWALFTHPLLDCFTTWGTKLFWPFTDYAVAFQSVFVIDPLYTVPFMVLLIWAMFKKRDNPIRYKINRLGLILSSLYLLLTVAGKARFDAVVESALAEQGIEYERFESRPAPLQTVLWTANVETKNAFLVGYWSHFEKNQSIDFDRYPKEEELLEPWANHPKMKQLTRITKGWQTARLEADTLVINDLRFGRVTGWHESDEWVFSYRVFPANPALGEPQFTYVQTRPEKYGEVLSDLWHRMHTR